MRKINFCVVFSFDLNRSLFFLLCVLMTTSMGCGTIVNQIGGNFKGEPSDMWPAIKSNGNRLSHAETLINKAFQFDHKDGNEIIDYHLHVIGVGHNFKPDPGAIKLPEPGTCNVLGPHDCNSPPCDPIINKEFLSWMKPMKRLEFLVFLSAMRITDITKTNDEFKKRLKEMVKNFRPVDTKNPVGKFCIFAMDAYHDDTGKIDWDRTDLYIPNDYVVKLAGELNDEIRNELKDQSLEDFFIPVISVHPLRENAVELLECYNCRGVNHVKWLPSVMNIDPASYTSAPFFKMMKEKEMILLTHTGDEESLEVYDDHQKFGNPMRLKQALELGVTVVMQHSGRVTKKIDIDYVPPQEKEANCPTTNTKQNFMLFLDMMNKKKI